ncbi:MAG: polysaccharide deacetylase [Clostridiales bacterium]|nr:polysaccharide deacetylase [Roseburia sp.]MDD7636344.1 polysaccharide deacetylase [Clostridiales bacterium]MDY4113036.1 polysaccharide deacetylase family protein [Roseburia sp.]
MQDKDSEALRNQRRRRKRIGRIKSAIVIIIAGWIMLSMILIVTLFVRTVSLEKKLDRLIQSNLLLSSQENVVSGLNEGEQVLSAENTEAILEASSAPQAVVVEDTENLAEAGDVHKVYLTFDDGPSDNTEAILDILAEYDVKATFFVVGKEDEVSQELYRRIVEEGHTLGMHSYSNRYSVIYQSAEAFETDYQKLKDYLFDVTGTECKFYRFPGGSSNQISNVPMSELIQFLNGQGTVYYDWNVSAGDAASAAYTADEIVENVTEDVVKYKTSVVLLHDAEDKSTTVEAIRPLIEALQEMDAEILPIDENTRVIQSVKADSVDDR